MLGTFVGSLSDIKAEHVEGTAYGKSSSIPECTECRVILPLSAILNLVDFLLAARLQTIIDESFLIPAGFLIGAKPGTQCLDIAHAGQLCLEKALDNHSQGAIGTADIRKYYDNLSWPKIVKLLDEREAQRNVLAACLMCQLSVYTTIKVCGNSILILGRSKGGITGSRIAGVGGQVPLAHAIESLAGELTPRSFPSELLATLLLLCGWIIFFIC